MTKLERVCCAFLASVVAGTALTSCASEQETREQLLERTPIGTKFEQVISFCNSERLTCLHSKDAGFLNQKTGQVVGVQSIWAVLGERRLWPIYHVSTSAYWGFDREGALVDIWVWKTVDAP